MKAGLPPACLPHRRAGGQVSLAFGATGVSERRAQQGRAFHTIPDRLGEYILVDYVANKRKNLRG